MGPSAASAYRPTEAPSEKPGAAGRPHHARRGRRNGGSLPVCRDAHSERALVHGLNSATVLVSTPDLRPSLLSVLQGLADNGLLQRVVTTLSFSARRLNRISRVPILGSPIANALQRRQLPAFLEGKTDAIWLGEFVRLIAAKSA